MSDAPSIDELSPEDARAEHARLGQEIARGCATSASSRVAVGMGQTRSLS